MIYNKENFKDLKLSDYKDIWTKFCFLDEAGSINKRGDKYKLELLELFKENLGTKSFISGFRNRNFNIFIDKDIKSRLPFEK